MAEAGGAAEAGGRGTAEAEVRFPSSYSMLGQMKIRPRGFPPTSESNRGTATLPRRVVVRQEYREAIRGPVRQKQQDEVAGYGAA